MALTNTLTTSTILPTATHYTTDHPSYMYPLRPRITITSRDGSQLRYIYDSFDPGKGGYTRFYSAAGYTHGYVFPGHRRSFTKASFSDRSFDTTQNLTSEDLIGMGTVNQGGIRVIKVNVDLAMNNAGQFDVWIEDSDEVIDRSVLGLGDKVIIEASKIPGQWQGLLHGYIRTMEVRRDDTNILIYNLSGYGSQIICNERIIDFQKFAALQEIGQSAPSGTDQSMLAYQLFRTVFEGTAHLPMDSSPTILQQGGFSEAGIDNRVDVFIPGIVDKLVEASATLDKIANYAGASWGIQNDIIYLRYPSTLHSGITIKDHKEWNDPADKTSYYVGSWNFVESMDQQDGFVNRLWLKHDSTSQTASVQSSLSAGFTTLYDRDIAQQIIPDSARLKNLALTLSLLGSGGSPQQQFVQGRIVHDKGGRPLGTKIMDFTIPVSTIPKTQSSVFNFTSTFATTDFPVGVPVWIILFAKGTSESETVGWWHDDDYVTPNRFSATRLCTLDPQTEDRNVAPLQNDVFGWATSDNGPVYSHGFFDHIRALSMVDDPRSIDRYGLSEAVMDINFIKDYQTAQVYASSILQSLAKPVRKYTIQMITIPNGPLILPGMQIDIMDSKSGLTGPRATTAEIQEVKYEFAAPSLESLGGTGGRITNSAPTSGPGRNPIGANYVEVMPISYVDYITDLMAAKGCQPCC